MFGLCVGIRIHSHGFDAHAAGSSGNTAGDFATVGDEDFFKHDGVSF
jgi:hypothetical protein